MKDKEKEEILGALDVLNKYRNFFYSSGDREEVDISNIIDDFLPKIYNKIVHDELGQMLVEKISMPMRRI